MNRSYHSIKLFYFGRVRWEDSAPIQGKEDLMALKEYSIKLLEGMKEKLKYFS
jgi:hypothetical protein